MSLLPLSNELCDSLRALSVKKRQGVLEIVAPQREYELTFLEGRIIHADRLDNPLCDFLFEHLCKDDQARLDPARLKDANKGDLITRIIENSNLTVKDLIAFKHDYDRQTLALLSGERSISFDFRTKIIRCPEGLALDLSPGHYLLDLLESAEAAAESEAAQAPAQRNGAAPKESSIHKGPGQRESTEKIRPPAVTVHFNGASAASEPAQSEIRPIKIAPAVATHSPLAGSKRRRKHRRPPRIGRWNKTARQDAARGKHDPFTLSGSQMFLGVKLLLFLTLVILAPPFLNAWVTTMITFSFPQ